MQRQPIPVLDMERERAATVSSPVITYTLSPEELERIFGKKKPEGSMPVFNPAPDGGRAAQARLVKNNPEVNDDMTELTKEQYLAERIDGANRSAICKKYFGKNAPGFYKRLGEWGIKDVSAEEIAIAEFQQRTVKGDEDNGKAKNEGQEAERQGQNPVSSAGGSAPEDDRSDVRSVPAGEGQVADNDRPESVDPFAGVEWFLPAEQRVKGPSVSLNSKGFAFDAEATKRMGLMVDEGLAVGAVPGRIVFAKNEKGVRLRSSSESSVRLQSRQIAEWQPFKTAAKKWYPLKHDTATGAYYIEVEVGG